MSDTDQNTATEKPGRRNRKSGSRNQKPDQQPDAEATIAAPADTAAIGDTAASDTIAPTDPAPVSFQTIANAYGDYTRKSLEQTRTFFEKLTGVRSVDKIIEVQAEFAKQSFETFVAGSQRICELQQELARQAFKPLQRLMDNRSRGQR